MAYFDFNFVTDPPNDETVDAQTQLNDNWQDVNDKIKTFNVMPNTIVNPPIGIEAFYPGSPSSDAYRIAAWDGTEWRRSINHTGVWTGWQPIDLRSPVVERSGFPCAANVDVVARRVIFSGGVQFNAAADPWPTNTDVEITDDDDIATSLTPAPGGLTYGQQGTSQVTTAGGFASANVRAQLVSSPDRVAIYVRFQGDSGGGNFVMLDGLTWWY